MQQIFDTLRQTIHSLDQILLIPFVSGLQLQISLRNIKKGEKRHIQRIGNAVGRNNFINGLINNISDPMHFLGRRIRA